MAASASVWQHICHATGMTEHWQGVAWRQGTELGICRRL